MPNAIEVNNLGKSYGEIKALDGVSLEVRAGTILGLLGPNGAGKTTLVRVLTTLLKPDSGQAKVMDLDVVHAAQELRAIIGLSGQYAALDENLTGRENLELVGKLYHLKSADVKARAAELLEQFGLTDAADRTVKTYSGGMRKRLDLAASLVGRPKVLFLDEPTTGLDLPSRLGMWKIIKALVADGTTLLLTTQYLEEADQLADKIAVVDHGRIIAEGTAEQLKNQIGADVLEILVDKADIQAAIMAIAGLGVGKATVNQDTGWISLPVLGGTSVLAETIRRLDATGIKVLDILQRRPTLDDVFLKLTGHVAEII